MAIQALDRATSHFLGSSQVLTSPTALVKELLDNALDAKATSIDIVVSANTLDKIEVRDNGHGIIPEDLELLGRRGYTSKLRKFEELKSVGGLTLGFRGEALASAAELGQVSIISRTEGEIVATAIKLKANEGLESRNPASHPVGTTVCIVNFLSKLPVRKQNALKNAKKNLSQIKDLLQSYALARLNVRLSLKILQAGKVNWSFAPRPKDSVRDIVSQIISRDITAQCMEKTSEVLLSAQIRALGHEHILRSNLPQNAVFTFQAFLPKPDADLSRITGGQYVSVDSRPVSCIRGTLKRVVAIYKSFINGIAASANLGNVKEPFLRLNIICPVASYDPNIEPAKDNVLFEDEALLLSLAEEWFKSLYGAQIHSMGSSQEYEIDSFEAKDVSQIRSKTVPQLDMSEDYTEDIELIEGRVREFYGQHLTPSVVRARSDALEGLDPWVIAKLTAPLVEKQPKRIELSKSEELLCAESNSAIPPKYSGTSNSTESHQSPESHYLPHVTSYVREAAVETDSLPSSLDGWLNSCNAMHVHGREFYPPGVSRVPAHIDLKCTSGNNDIVVNARDMARNLPWSPPTTQERLQPDQQTKPRTPFVLPSITLTPIFLQVPSTPVDIPKDLSSRRLQHSENSSAVGCDREEQECLQKAPLNLHVEQALDFERRKEIATLKLRARLRQSQASSSVSLRQTNKTMKWPPQNDNHQGVFAVTVQNTSQRVSSNDLIADKTPIETSLPDGDPRAYLMRRQHSRAVQVETVVAKPKLKRARTILLPLETTPTYMELHKLLRVMKVDVAHVHKAVLDLTGYDEYITLGKVSRGLDNITQI